MMVLACALAETGRFEDALEALSHAEDIRAAKDELLFKEQLQAVFEKGQCWRDEFESSRKR